jgi:hypothetical protein
MQYASQVYQNPDSILRNAATVSAIRGAADRLYGTTGTVRNFGRDAVQSAMNLILNSVPDPTTREALRGQILRATGLSSGGRHTKHHQSKRVHKKQRKTRRR